MIPAQGAKRPVFHGVVLYEDPLELVRALGEFATAALDRGGSLVLIAERGHLEAADQWIRLSRAAATLPGEPAVPGLGRYQAYDADDLVDPLCLLTDPVGAFEGLLHEVCRHVPPDTEGVHFYWDLVGRLWARGQSDLALAVEQVGNRLASDGSVAILCAYPTGALTDTAQLASIRDCHSEVVEGSVVHALPAAPDDPRVERTRTFGARGPSSGASDDPIVSRASVFPSSIPACRAARRFVRRAVEESGNDDELADAAELICSELAANAVRHAHSVFTVRVDCDPDAVRVSVTDEAPTSTSGSDRGPISFPVGAARGLGIVSTLAVDWGVDDEESGGKVVWAKLGRAQGAA